MRQSFDNVKTILLDIEGTICPISFVKDTLFPYAIQALPSVLNEKWDDPNFIQYRDAFPPETRTSPEALEAYVRDLTERDVKVACLKNLQGYLWQSGYESKVYSTPLFPDVLPAIEKWHKDGRQINIYSSGSIFAQKLLFAHIARDVTFSGKESSGKDVVTVDKQDFISHWFDTTNAGPKTQAESYTKIASVLNSDTSNHSSELTARHTLFLSDNVKEIEAALLAGMKAVVVDRPGNAALSAEDHDRFDVITSFERLTRALP